MNLEWKPKMWWCNKCNHYISNDYSKCPYCKVLARERKEIEKIIELWRKQKSIIMYDNLLKGRRKR